MTAGMPMPHPRPPGSWVTLGPVQPAQPQCLLRDLDLSAAAHLNSPQEDARNSNPATARGVGDPFMSHESALTVLSQLTERASSRPHNQDTPSSPWDPRLLGKQTVAIPCSSHSLKVVCFVYDQNVFSVENCDLFP